MTFVRLAITVREDLKSLQSVVVACTVHMQGCPTHKAIVLQATTAMEAQLFQTNTSAIQDITVHLGQRSLFHVKSVRLPAVPETPKYKIVSTVPVVVTVASAEKLQQPDHVPQGMLFTIANVMVIISSLFTCPEIAVALSL